jgi:hypothetical protein
VRLELLDGRGRAVEKIVDLFFVVATPEERRLPENDSANVVSREPVSPLQTLLDQIQ